MGSELNLEQIKELMQALRESDLTRIELKIGEMELTLSREEVEVCKRPPPPPPPPPHSHPEPAAPQPKVEVVEGRHIESPMVGTFYQSPSPDDAAFVKVGDQVSEDTIVCIIEAMKVMNEVKAGVSGRIKEILVDNTTPVEFGTKLFEIE